MDPAGHNVAMPLYGPSGRAGHNVAMPLYGPRVAMPLYGPRHNVAMLELHVAKFVTRTGNDVKVRHALYNTILEDSGSVQYFTVF